MRTAEELREDFLLDPAIVHLNHGSFGAAPRPVLERQQELRDALERDPVEFLGRRLPDALATVRARLASYLGVADPDQLVLVANSTTGLNAVAMSIALAAGDEIVITDREYGAMKLLWREIARRTEARLVVAALPVRVTSADELAETIWSAVTPRTRALFFSHVTSETALVLPVEELCRRAREAGIISIVDGAHGPGQLPLVLDELGADYYAGNGHKWLCAPKGSAFLYAADEHRADLRPPIVSWGWDDDYQERFAWGGTDDPTAVLTIPCAIDYQEARDWGAVQARCRSLARRTQDEVLGRLGGEPIAPDEVQAPQMVAIAVPHAEPEALQRELREQHRIEVPVHDVDGATLLRISVAAYTTGEDCRQLVDALETVPRNAKSR